MALNLEKQLLFYAQYHHDPTNIAIHVTCVPVIVMTAFLFATNSPPLFPLPNWLSVPNLEPNLGTIAAVLYSTLYVLMEPVAGALLAPLLIAGTAFCSHLTSTYGAAANYWAIGAHLVSWIAQFIGHGKFEGRAPALLDNLVQALFLAPLFVWLEVLFHFGYRPELQSRLRKGVEREIEKFRRKQANGAAADGKAKA